MKAGHVVVALLAGLLAGFVATALVSAQTGQVALTVTPDTVTLASGETAQVLISAHVPLTTVQAITLSAFTDADVDIAIGDPARTDQPLRGDIVWTLTVTRSAGGRAVGTIYVVASYVSRESDGVMVPGVVTASLRVQERLPDAIGTIITASLASALEMILDQQVQQVYVVVTNLSSVPVTVTGLNVWPIARITPIVEDVSSGRVLAPQQSHPFTITLAAGDAVQAGKHLLVVQLDSEWEKAGLRSTGSLVLTKEFQAGVFGESAIKDATGIPSTMFIPGFLFVVTVAILTRWVWKKDLVALDFKKPDFWFLAITVSLLTLAFYPQLTGPMLSFLLRRPMSARNYLQGYGFNDILLLWLGAVALGVGVWAIGSLLWRCVLLVQGALAAFSVSRERARRAALVPAADDAPIVILRKIANNQAWVDLRRVDYPKDNSPQTVYVLPSGFPEPGKVWVAPRIQLHWLTADDRLKDEFDILKDDRQQFRTLIRRLEEWQNPADPAIELDWDRSGAHVRRPRLVEESETTTASGGDPLFKVV